MKKKASLFVGAALGIGAALIICGSLYRWNGTVKDWIDDKLSSLASKDSGSSASQDSSASADSSAGADSSASQDSSVSYKVDYALPRLENVHTHYEEIEGVNGSRTSDGLYYYLMEFDVVSDDVSFDSSAAKIVSKIVNDDDFVWWTDMKERDIPLESEDTGMVTVSPHEEFALACLASTGTEGPTYKVISYIEGQEDTNVVETTVTFTGSAITDELTITDYSFGSYGQLSGRDIALTGTSGMSFTSETVTLSYSSSLNGATEDANWPLMMTFDCIGVGVSITGSDGQLREIIDSTRFPIYNGDSVTLAYDNPAAGESVSYPWHIDGAAPFHQELGGDYYGTVTVSMGA